MTATTVRATAPALVPPPARSAASRARWAVTDSVTMVRRSMLQTLKSPELIVFMTIQPIMFVLLFRYVFGGAIKIPWHGSYVDFLMPGIFVQTVAFGSTVTGVGLAEDLSKGIIDRFRSLPMARSAVLVGRTLSDGVRNLFTVGIMAIVGVIVGFRVHKGVLATLAALGMLALFGYVFSWISAFIGLSVRDVETANVAGFVWLFPLTFASAAFVDTRSMPGWLQSFANNQPLTQVINSVRGLLGGGPPGAPVLHPTLLALAWLAGILAVFVPLAVRNYRRAV